MPFWFIVSPILLQWAVGDAAGNSKPGGQKNPVPRGLTFPLWLADRLLGFECLGGCFHERTSGALSHLGLSGRAG